MHNNKKDTAVHGCALHRYRDTATNVNRCCNWLLLLVYGWFANQLAYRHLLYWTEYICKCA